MKLFQRKIEDFKCENCNKAVKGNGYTNHCPYCLYSKHVDVNPGDRAESCGGLMKPVAVISKDDTYVLKHKCLICGHEKNNKLHQDDDFDVVLRIARTTADTF